MVHRTTIYAMLFVAAFTAMTGCRLFLGSGEVHRIAQMATIRGIVHSPNVDPEPVFVLAFVETDTGPSLLNYAALLRAGQYSMRLPKGRVFVWAFEDLDHDFKLDPGEPVGRAGSSEGFDLRSGALVDGKDIRLSGDTQPPGWMQVDLSATGYNPDLGTLKTTTGEVVSLDDPRFGSKMGNRGFWRPLSNIEQSRMGLFMLEPYDPCRSVVLFVHGIAGSPQDLRTLMEQVDRRRFQVWFYAYSSALRLRMISDHLAESLRVLRVKYKPPPIAIVAHSMGGLVARAVLLEQDASKQVPVRAFVSISTPWNGHARAEDGVRYSPYVAPAWVDMIPGSQFIRAVLEPPLPPTTTHHLLFGFGKRTQDGAPGDGAVTLESMLDPRAQRRATTMRGYPQTHTGILTADTVIESMGQILAQYAGETPIADCSPSLASPQKAR